MKILSFLMITLKYLLILFLVLLALLILALLLILFVPVKYKIYFSKVKDTSFDIKISWLFSLILVQVNTYKGDNINTTLKVLGIPVNLAKSKENTSTNTKKSTKKEFNKAKTKKTKTYNENIKTKHKNEHKNEHKTKFQTKVNTGKRKENKKNSIVSDILKFKHKKQLTADAIVFIIHILKQLVPGKGMIRVEFGKDNPADTGTIMAGVSVLYPLYYSFMNIEANFEKECFYIMVDTEGEIIVGKLVYETLKFITKQSAREAFAFVKKLRKEKKRGRKVTN